MTVPFEGMPAGWATLLWVGLVVIIGMLAWTAVLFVRGQRARRRAPAPPADGGAGLLWIFFVPALNEAITIADSVRRLLEVDVPRRKVVVIDDGSDDGTPAALAAIAHPDLLVLRRELPHAREGKATALNHAYRALDDAFDSEVDRNEVIVAIVDADGRLDPAAPRYVAAHFADQRVGGVQSLVRIYNRARPLAWLQNVEFEVYGHLFQAGRNDWGTAGLGGNGQFNRLRALDEIADADGPWHDRLTEDQDLGLRLLAAGWEGRQELRAVIDQQGLSTPRPLFRQRTRWSQGNLQALSLTGEVWRAPFPRAARVELLVYLLMPLWQGLVGLALLASIYLLATGQEHFWGRGFPWEAAFAYVLAFGGTILGCIAGRSSEGPRGWLPGFLIAHPYAIYTWFLWPILIRSALRQLTERRDWAKTEREPLEPASEPPADARLGRPPPAPAAQP
jgi:1,2-diacylglycerol 3-beta-glucosyltransferase